MTKAMKYSPPSAGSDPTSHESPERPQARGKASIEARVRSVEEAINELREEFRASAVAVSAASLRVLNERQAHEGLGRLRADLRAMRDKGIIDAQGNRVSKGLPAGMVKGDSSCDV